MPEHWTSELVGYRTREGERVTDTTYTDVMGHVYGGGIDGLLIHAWNPDDPEEDHYFWVYHIGYFTNWQDAWKLIRKVAKQYGIEL